MLSLAPPAGTAPAHTSPCAACPWRTANHGKRHPGSWYTKGNRRRLWSGLRAGEMMSCHPTDPGNPVPEGLPAPADGTTIKECAGAHVLLQRELAIFTALCARMDVADAYRRYTELRRRGITRVGLMRYMVRGTPLGDGHRPTVQQLDTPCSLDADALAWPEPEVPDAHLDVVVMP